MPFTPDQWKTRLRAALAAAGHAADEDVVEELAQHAREMYVAARAEGESAEAAARRVDLQIALWAGDAAMLKRRRPAPPAIEPPPPRPTSWATGLAADLRYALRLLHRRAAFTLLVVATMALGIGGTTALFSVAHAVLFSPLPWHDADRLAVARETRGGHTPRFGEMSNGSYLAWRDEADVIDAIAAWTNRTVTMSGHGEAERVQIAAVAPELFRMLGAAPLAGTLLLPGDDAGRRGKVVLLSEPLWRTRFGGDPAAVGRSVQIEGEAHTIVGVLPDRLAYPDRLTRAWVPLTLPPPGPTSATMLSAVVKLREGVSVSQAAAEGTARARTAPEPIEMLQMALYGGAGPVEITLTPLREARTAGLRPALLVFLAAVGLLFITATANVASLLLARATGRTREMAIRAALGAGGARVMRQLLVESVSLGILGGAAGLALAWVVHQLLPALLTPEVMAWGALGINGPVVAFATALSLFTGVAVGLLPALRARRLSLVESLGQDAAASVGVTRGSGTARARMAIMAGQVAVACVLLVGASLLARSFVALLQADRGYEPSHLLTARVPLPSPAFTPAQRAEFAAAVLERLRRLPAVSAAGITDAPPIGRGSTAAFTMDGRTVQAESTTVSPGYFEAMGMRIVEGRGFTEEDAASGRPMLVVNRTFARSYLDGHAAGRHVRTGLAEKPAFTEIIGLVDDVRHRPEQGGPEPQVYRVAGGRTGMSQWSGVTILARTSGDPVALIPTLRGIIREQHPGAAADSIMTMEERLRTALEGPRVAALLISSFAALALLIAAVGLFGSLSYSVAQRSREMAVRTALGARPGDIVRLVLRQGLAVAGAGAALGLMAAAALTSALGTALYGIRALDPVTYAVVPLLLLVVAVAACIVPARRAARMDPLGVLKAE